jgi:hypothetical protein
MMLHMLYGTEQLAECIALLTSSDSVIVMEPTTVIIDSKTLSSLPCPAFALNNAALKATHNTNLPRINIAKWVELTSQHPHSMTWL